MRRQGAQFWIICTVLATILLWIGRRYFTAPLVWLGAIGQYHGKNNQDFRVEGDVVDQNGNPLNGVRLNITKSRFVKMGVESERESNHVNLDTSHFQVEADNCRNLELTFSKKGYYLGGVSFNQGGNKENVQVVLRKQGQIAQPAKYWTKIEFSADGSGVVLDLDLPPIAPGGSHLAYKVHPSTRPVERLTELDSLPGNAVYMIADVQTDGTISVIQRPWKNALGRVDIIPSKVVLRTSDPNGGLIRFVRQPGTPERFQMFEAPAEGYQPELVILPVDYPAPGKSMEPTWFYIRSNGEYGRGNFTSATVSPDGKKVELSVLVLMQHDGTRNLEFESGSESP